MLLTRRPVLWLAASVFVPQSDVPYRPCLCTAWATPVYRDVTASLSSHQLLSVFHPANIGRVGRTEMKELKKQASMLKLLGGEVYFQQYEQKKELGRGKFGVVFQVQDKDNKRTYAAKHIKTRKKEQRERVIEEIAILKKFSNPHIIRWS